MEYSYKTYLRVVFELFSMLGMCSVATSQTLSDGPIEIIVRVRDINVTAPETDISFFGVLGVPEDYSFKLWARDDADQDGMGWIGGACLTAGFTPPGNSPDFNQQIFQHLYASATVPRYLDLRLDAWEDEEPDQLLGIGCGGSRCEYDEGFCCGGFLFGLCLGAIDSDDLRCNSGATTPFVDNLDYRLGNPCQWYDHGYLTGSCSENYYKPRIETYWRYTKGDVIGNPIDLGTLTNGTLMAPLNSNECYTDAYPASAGKDVFYRFTTTKALNIGLSLCVGTAFDSQVFLLDSNGDLVASNDDFCGTQSALENIDIPAGQYTVVVSGKNIADAGLFSLKIQTTNTIWHVKPAGNDSDNGLAWGTAFQTLQQALLVAASGDSIWVAAGTYKPTSGADRSISFVMKNGLGVYGGFPNTGNPGFGDRDWNNNPTILSGDISTPDTSDNSYHVVFFDHATGNTVLDGFTITGGNGGMAKNGGGIYNDGSGVGRQSNPRIANCILTGNVARSGAGLFNDGYRGNSSPEVVNCAFSGNKATRDGGGVYNFGGNNGNSSPLFVNCVFSGNKAERIGGGVFNDAVDATGGVCNPVFMNCSFSGNQADFGVGGMYNDAYTGTCSPTLTNCILWGNAGQIDNRNGTPVVAFSIVQNGYAPCTDCPGGDGNVDPLFVSQPPIALGATGNLRLQVCSPAIDAGTSTGAPTTDLDDNARQDVLPGGGIVDIGAYEFQSNLGAGTVTWTGAADTDWDNPCNWDGNTVPGAVSDVLIPDVTNDPVVMAGTAAVAKSVTISTDAALTVEATGSLTINGFANNPNDFTTAGMHNSGTVTNNGVITLGSTASVSNHAIYNNGTVFNNAGAQMHLDRAEKDGIENNGTFTNAGKITIGAIDLGQFGILNKGTFDNNNGAEIVIDRSDDTGLRNTSGTFTNAGKITLGAGASVGTNGLINFAVFNNQLGGEINLDNSFKVGLYNNGTFTNEAKIKIGQMVSPGDYGLWQQSHSAMFHNNAGGEIYIDRAGDTGLRNQFGTFNNAAKIVIGAVADVGYDGILNSATLNNTPCTALIHIVSDDVISNIGTFTNAGIIIENATGASSISSNSGVVQNLNGGTFTIGSGNMPVNTAGDVWTGCTDADWATAGNWLDGTVPTATDDAVIPNVTNDPIISTAAVARSVNVLASGSLAVATTGSLTINSDASPLFSNSGTVVNEGTVSLNTSVTFRFHRLLNRVTGTFTNKNVLRIGNTSGSNYTYRSIFNMGDFVNMAGSIDISSTNRAIYLESGATFTNNASIVCNTGFNSVDSSAVYLFGGTFNNTPCSATLLATAGPSTLGRFQTSGGTFHNDGLITENTSGLSNITSNTGIVQNLGGGSFFIGSGNPAITNPAPQNSCCAAPEAICKSYTAVLGPNGTAIVTPADVDNGSTYECGLRSMTISPDLLNCSHLGPQTVTLTVTDVKGNSDACIATVTVTDNILPTIICPSSFSRNVDPNQCSAVVAYSNPSFSDNCTATLTRTGGPAPGSAFPTGTTMVNWKVTDAAGNEAVCQFTVTVVDNLPPSLTCPANIVRSADAGQCYAVVTYATPTATDNCGTPTVTRTSAANTASGSQFPKGTTVVEWKATDTATPTANAATCSFTVTVNDSQQPAITCPASQTVGNTPGSCSATVNYATPAYSDNCAGGGATLQSGLPSGDIFPKGQTTVIWRATDAVGLTRTCSFRVTVNDTEAPVITCPGSQSAGTSPSSCTANVTYPTPTATDNCPGAVTVVRISGPTSGSAFSLGATSVVWRAIDGAGRSSTCSFSVTVADATPPVVTCPGNVAVTGSGSPCTAVATYTTPTATDNCGVQSVFLLSGLPSGSSFPAGATVNTWRAVDNVGLSHSCSFTVTVGCGANSGQEAADREQSAPENSVDALQALAFSLAPNPAQDEVRVSIENLGATGGELAVHDARGRLMWQQRVESSVVGRQSSAVSLTDFPTGVYFVTLRAEGQTLTKRLVVQRL